MKKIKNSQPQTKCTGSYKKKSVVELVAACNGKEIKKHLLHAPQNVNYNVT